MTSEGHPEEKFRSREQQAAVGLLRTADAVRRHFSHVIERHGITLQQYNVLRILRGAGPEGLPTLTVGERMIEQTPGVTRLVDRLERKKLVVRVPCPRDRRRVYCQITPEGLALLDSLDEPIDRADEQAVAALLPSDLNALIEILDRVRAAHAPA